MEPVSKVDVEVISRPELKCEYEFMCDDGLRLNVER